VIKQDLYLQVITVKKDRLTYIQTCCIQHYGSGVGLFHIHT